MSVLSKKSMEAMTTLSKWQKGDIKRIYVNSPIYRWFGITMYYEKAPEGHTRYRYFGNRKLSTEMDCLVTNNLGNWLKSKNNLFFYSDGSGFCVPEYFDDFWNGLESA